MSDVLAFLSPSAPWATRAPFGDPATVLVEDISSITKHEVYGDAGDLGSAVQRDGAWWCPVTPERTLVLNGSAGDLDVTAVYGALAISGPLARERFARFCALDLRDRTTPVHAFRPGSVARTPGFVLRETEDRFIVVFGAAYGEHLWQVVTDA